MSDLESLGHIVRTDVLVIGGGIAGIWAANRARESGADALIVEKGPPLGWAGQAFFSGGGVEAAPPWKDPEDHVKDVMYLGDGLYEQDFLTAVFKQSWDRIEDYRRLGVEFLTNEDGSLRHVPQRGLEHLWCYIGKPWGAGGENIMRALAREAGRLGVRYMQRIYVTDLLKRDGAVVGAVGFDTRSGDFYVFQAGAIVLATGNCSMKGHYEDILMSCGDGIDMAYRAGAELKNSEFCTIWVVPRHFRWEGITYLLPMGARFVDARGEPFADRYSPKLGCNIDYNYLVRFMALEARKGNNRFYVDCSGLSEADKRLMEPSSGGWTELQYRRLLEAGIRPFEERQEWCPGINYLAVGVQTDLSMATAVPGLYVAGKTRSIDPGIYFGGWSLCIGSATGRWAGESAAAYAREHGQTPPEPALAKECKRRLFEPLGDGGESPADVLGRVQRAVFPYEVSILKKEATLREALATLEAIRSEQLPRMGAKNVRDLMRLQETACITGLAELFLRGSLLRTESRASHFREDHPRRDDANWLKWLYVRRKDDGGPEYREVPLPLDRYRFKPDRFYSDNFAY